MLKSTQLRPGMIIMHEGDLHVVYSVDHRTPGNKHAQPAHRVDDGLSVPRRGIRGKSHSGRD